MNDLVSFLRRLGYLNQAAPDLKGEDFERLVETDQPVIDALALFQGTHHQVLDELCLAVHGRLCATDGNAGPATKYLVKMPRCNHPDFEPDSESETYVLWAREEANWPTACRGKLVAGRSFKSLPGMNEADTHGVWWALCHNWSESIADLTITPGEVGDQSSSNFYAGLEKMRGSTLAWSYLAQNSCSVRLAQAYNTNVTWNRRLAATTATHEVGHALGLGHQSDAAATMYPSVTNASMNRYGYPNATDIAAMKQLGYRPHDNWEDRRLPEGRLFLPRDQTPPTTPIPDIAERVKDLEEKAFGNLVTDAGQDARLEWLASRIKALEERI